MQNVVAEKLTGLVFLILWATGVVFALCNSDRITCLSAFVALVICIFSNRILQYLDGLKRR